MTKIDFAIKNLVWAIDTKDEMSFYTSDGVLMHCGVLITYQHDPKSGDTYTEMNPETLLKEIVPNAFTEAALGFTEAEVLNNSVRFGDKFIEHSIWLSTVRAKERKLIIKRIFMTTRPIRVENKKDVVEKTTNSTVFIKLGVGLTSALLITITVLWLVERRRKRGETT
jgi:hypothetical protein